MIPKALRFLLLALLLQLPAMVVMAQNTKGDTPTPREARFKTPAKKSKKPRPARRVRPRDERASPNTATTPYRRPQGGERVGQPLTPIIRNANPGEYQRPWEGDMAGRRIKPREPSKRARTVHPQPPTTNYSSLPKRRSPRANENPNVRRVQRMQRQSENEPRVGRPIRPTYHKTRPMRQERAWRGDIAGRRIRANRSEAGTPSRSMKTGAALSVRPRTAGRPGFSPRTSGRARNMFTRRGFYVNNQTRTRQGLRTSQRTTAATTFRQPDDGRRKPTIIPRSASAGFFRRRSINTWANFPRPKRKGERAITTDLAGHPLRMKNFETRRPQLTNPTLRYRQRAPGGDRASRMTGGYVSRSESGKAWKGDIAHRKIRGGFRSKKGEARPGVPLLGIGPGENDRRAGMFQGNIRQRRGHGDQGASYTGNIRQRDRALRNQGEGYAGNIRVRRGMQNQGENYTGNIRVGRRGMQNQGEGYSGNIRVRRGQQDQGEGYTGNIKVRRGTQYQGEGYTGNIRVRKGVRDQGEGYTGNIRTRRTLQEQGEGYTGNIRARRGLQYQGEGYTGNIRVRREVRDQGEGYTGNIRTRQTYRDQGEGYTGNIRLRKGVQYQGEGYTGNIRTRQTHRDQGEGYTGNIRLRKGVQYQGEGYTGNIRTRPTHQEQGEGYTGNIRFRRPEKGGGSISGSWNNKGRPIANRMYADHHTVNRYTGNLKARRPEKGGGSISGSWNNKGEPIEARSYSNHRTVNRYTGSVARKRNEYIRNPNADDEALRVRRPSEATEQTGRFTGHLKSPKYVLNPNSAKEALKVRQPGAGYNRGGSYTGNVRRDWRYARNPNAADGALLVRKPDAAYIKATRYVGRTKRNWDYIRNPASADLALKVREPGRAFTRATAYQGNIRVKRFNLFEKQDLHPDARFVKTNRNNVAGERDVTTNFMLWWARLFRKNETQPEHLKQNDKGRKPRYDKGEAGLWYD